jgi:hypothetical protein
MVTWGTNPGHAIGISETVPRAAAAEGVGDALAYMGLAGGRPIAGTRIDVAFIGSCTNGRLSDLEEAARVARGRRVAPHVNAIVVPGSQGVARAAERAGLDVVFRVPTWTLSGTADYLLGPKLFVSGRVGYMDANQHNDNVRGDPRYVFAVTNIGLLVLAGYLLSRSQGGFIPPHPEVFALYLPGLAGYIAGLSYIARAKGYNPSLGLVGLSALGGTVGIIGALIILAMPIKSEDGEVDREAESV